MQIGLILDQYYIPLLYIDSGVTPSFEEVLAKDGLTLADIGAMEDVEIE